LTVEASPGTKPSPTGRRFGYAAAAVVNAGLLFVVTNLLEWDLLPFLTNDFDRVVPIISVSLVATIVVNLIYLFFDPDWFKSLSQIGLLGISMAATVRMYRIFPFDFSAYEIDWATVTRVLLILGMVGIVVAIVVEAVKLVTRAGRS
jgi:hypothetical protein